MVEWLPQTTMLRSEAECTAALCPPSVAGVAARRAATWNWARIWYRRVRDVKLAAGMDGAYWRQIIALAVHGWPTTTILAVFFALRFSASPCSRKVLALACSRSLNVCLLGGIEPAGVSWMPRVCGRQGGPKGLVCAPGLAWLRAEQEDDVGVLEADRDQVRGEDACIEPGTGQRDGHGVAGRAQRCQRRLWAVDGRRARVEQQHGHTAQQREGAVLELQHDPCVHPCMSLPRMSRGMSMQGLPRRRMLTAEDVHRWCNVQQLQEDRLYAATAVAAAATAAAAAAAAAAAEGHGR